MVESARWYDGVAFPALLRAARNTYGSAIRQALSEAGCDDMPRNGSYVVGAIARTGSPLGDIIRAMGISKQTASALIDTLVTRGYIDRAPDPEDRRRMTISLTERGRHAAAAARSAIERVDAEVESILGSDLVGQARTVLGLLIDLGGRAASGAEVAP